jgi:DegV family protein with EDD domain
VDYSTKFFFRVVLRHLFPCFYSICCVTFSREHFKNKDTKMIKIIADTTSCLTPAEASQLEIHYLPQIIVFGNETYRDDTEMDAQTFIQRLQTSSVLPKTAAPPPALYAPIFEELSAQGHTMIVLTPSAQVSGTYRSAAVACQDFPTADIRVVDTQLVAGGFGSLVIQAKQWVDQGMDADTLVANVTAMSKRERVFFLVDTLEYLYKGGRIGAAKALFGSLLQMKPILSFQEGRIVPFASQRTHKRALAHLKEVVLADCPRDPSAHLCLMHGAAEEEARGFAAELGNLLGIPVKDIPIYHLPPAILVHAGPGVIGISYFLQPGQTAS